MQITKRFLDAEIDFKRRARDQAMRMGQASQASYAFEQAAMDIRTFDTQIGVLQDLRKMLDEPEEGAS